MTILTQRQRFCLASRYALLLLVSSVFVTCTVAHADTITLTSSDVAPIEFSPADDNVSFYGSTSTYTDGGTLTFLQGNFYVGNSPISDQSIFFSFVTSVTLNGITQNITVSGEDDVTSAADTLLIYAGAPVLFGDLEFKVDPASVPVGEAYATVPFALQADVSKTPEPSSLLLLGTGVFGLISVGVKRGSGVIG